MGKSKIVETFYTLKDRSGKCRPKNGRISTKLNFWAITLSQITADDGDEDENDKNNDDVGAREDKDYISSVQ